MSNSNTNYPNLFLFCIGGTGSRVLKALTFLLSTGVEVKAKKIIPIIIDPDRANGDVNRTNAIVKKYKDIRKELEFESSKFFQTEIETLSSLDALPDEEKTSTTGQGFKFGIDGTKEGKFREFIAYDQLDGGNKALLNTLFTEDNLNAELRVGFKGNPHLGSIVLNRFSVSEDFKFFASRFSDNDRIFIVSSIFGGTGAAGFPLLVKNIRQPRVGLKNPERLKNAKLGAITVTPYFNIKQKDDGSIDSGTFISKTKAALEYYAQNITGNNSLNALYYVGDTETLDYDNNEGEEKQENYAHLIELIGALSIIDFMDIKDEKLVSNEGTALDPIYKEYGLNGDMKEVNFYNLGRRSKEKIFQNMIQYMYSYLYWEKILSNGSGIPKQPWANKGAIKFDRAFLTGEFFGEDLRKFNARFLEWLKEMSINERGFRPFRLDVGNNVLHELIVGCEQKAKGFLTKRANWDFGDFDGYLNDAARSIGDIDQINKFMAIFYQATENIFTDRIQ
ncbi:MAG: hypothetical protein AAFO82_04720 [Bacteroidota bacterium]